jgi:hypothetical protein
VRVEEAAQLRAYSRAVQMRRVRITRLVAEDVVATVVRDPTDERAFDRERTGRCEGDLEPARGTEAAMREEAVVPDGDAEAAHEIERGGDDEVARVERLAPQQGNGDRQRGHGADHEQRGDDSAEQDARTTRWIFGGARRRGGSIEQRGHGTIPCSHHGCAVVPDPTDPALRGGAHAAR